MTVVTDAPFTAEELEPTLRPLVEASLLPSRAYTDEAVAGWEARNFFLGGWICVGHVSAFAGRGDFVTAEISGESLLFVARAAASTTSAATAARGWSPSARAPSAASSAPTTPGATASTASLKNAPHTEELEGFDPACNGLRQIRTETLGGLVFADASGEAPPLADHVGDARRAPRGLPQRRASSARRGSTTTSRRTGRPSSRTTPSACTARACTPSSTGSATT